MTNIRSTKRNLILVLGAFACLAGTFYKLSPAITEENALSAPIENEENEKNSKSMEVSENLSPLEQQMHGDYDADFEKAAIPVPHKIARVTVFSDRATVYREAKVNFKTGFRWIAFTNLPANFDKQSLRVKASEAFKGRISQIIIQDSFEKVTLPGTILKELAELRSLYGTLLDQNHQYSSLDNQFDFIHGLKLEAPFTRAPATVGYKSFTASPQILKNAMDEINDQSKDLNSRRLLAQ